MDPSGASKAPHSTAPTQAVVAADELWKFQLRKENRALVDRMDADRKLVDSREAEFKRLFKIEQDKNAALAARLLELENTSLTQEQWSETRQFLELIRTNRDQFFTSGIMGEEGKAATEQRQADRHRNESASARSRPLAPASQPPIAPSPRRPQTTMLSDPKNTNQLDNLANVNPHKRSRPDALLQSPSGIQAMAVMVDPGTHEDPNDNVASNRSIKKARKAPSKERQRRQTRSSQINTSVEAPATQLRPAAQASTSTHIKPPKLKQGKKPMDVYYNYANEIFATIPDTGPEGEFDFVNLFLKGIQGTKDRETAVSAMQRLYDSKFINKTPRIQCQWDQVLEGLVRANLVRRAT